jgi:kynurenine formamidase
MRTLAISISAGILVAAMTAGVVRSQGAGTQGGTSRPQVTKAEFDRWKTELSNWGRWGKDDQLGALNLITPAKRKQAAALVKDGVTVSLAVDANFQVQGTGPTARAPYVRTVTSAAPTGAGDRLDINFHGSTVTHIDAFAHRFFDGKMYNGFSWEEITMADGARKNSIYNLRAGIMTRGILMDIPRLKGVEYLEPGTRIYVEDLEAWEKKAGIKVSAGDAVFIRVGRWTRMKQNPSPSQLREAGVDASIIPWLKQRDVALLGSEHPHDAQQQGDMPGLPVHDFALISLGVHLFDNCSLDELAEAAAARKRWEFMLVVGPLRVPGGTGSPVNPIATF